MTRHYEELAVYEREGYEIIVAISIKTVLLIL